LGVERFKVGFKVGVRVKEKTPNGLARAGYMLVERDVVVVTYEGSVHLAGVAEEATYVHGGHTVISEKHSPSAVPFPNTSSPTVTSFCPTKLFHLKNSRTTPKSILVLVGFEKAREAFDSS